MASLLVFSVGTALIMEAFCETVFVPKTRCKRTKALIDLDGDSSIVEELVDGVVSCAIEIQPRPYDSGWSTYGMNALAGERNLVGYQRPGMEVVERASAALAAQEISQSTVFVIPKEPILHTQHRRIRKGRVGHARRATLEAIKARFGLPNRTAANAKAVHSFAFNYLMKLGVQEGQICKIIPLVVEAAFVPNRYEVEARGFTESWTVWRRSLEYRWAGWFKGDLEEC
jgi:hypothetical protein